VDDRPVDRDEAGMLSAEVGRVVDRHGRFPAGVAVGVGRGEEIATLGRGRIGVGRPGEPGSETIFEIGSITKVFTATLLALLAEEGLVAIDEPVNDLLPEGARLDCRDRPVTLQDLATHTSGLPRLPRGWFRRALGHRADPYAHFTSADLDDAIARARPRGAPGRTVRYSNFGAGLLGHTLELRTGLGYAALVEARICAPLGLADTRVTVPDAELLRFADGHDRRGRPVPHWEMRVLTGAGALRSTVADLMVFLQAQCCSDATAGGSALHRAIRRTQVPLHERKTLGQGLGWTTLSKPNSDTRLLMHNGGTGGFSSYCACVPQQGMRVVVLANSARSVDKVGWGLMRALRE
jgi:D-alanyl-D-alanine-carboxypeptidase/D-alanyl-D-alanine-endopeptidase